MAAPARDANMWREGPVLRREVFAPVPVCHVETGEVFFVVSHPYRQPGPGILGLRALLAPARGAEQSFQADQMLRRFSVLQGESGRDQFTWVGSGF